MKGEEPKIDRIRVQALVERIETLGIVGPDRANPNGCVLGTDNVTLERLRVVGWAVRRLIPARCLIGYDDPGALHESWIDDLHLLTCDQCTTVTGQEARWTHSSLT